MATLHTVRIKADAAQAARSPIAAASWKGRATAFAVGLFNAAAIDDLAGVESVTLVVKASPLSTAAPLMAKTLPAAELTACTAAEWQAGSGQHAVFEFSAAECNVPVTGRRQSFHLVILVTLTNGAQVTYGLGTLLVHFDNADAVGNPPENPDPALTIAQGDARYVRGAVLGNKLVLSTGHFIWLNEPEA